ncbi:MAG: ROK family protein [Chloroflexi bacterium]|nr:MAG: ROK family protein [Chloroflexota bacterium]
MDNNTELNAVGVDIGGSSIKVGIVTATGHILHQRILPLKRATAPVLIQEVLTAIASLRRIAPISAIGIASTGVTDAERGVILQSTSIRDYDGTNWKSILASKYDLPVIVENDVKAAAWGEFKEAYLPPDSTVALIAVGTGIGCGIIIDGKIWRGSGFAAGEIGHITINAHGPQYHGNVGCLEYYASAPSIVMYVRERIQAHSKSIIPALVNGDLNRLSLPLIKQAEDMGDQLAKEAFREAGEMLGIGIVNVVHLLNPDIVILGGGVVEASTTYVDAAISLAMRRILSSARNGLTIKRARLGNQAALVGAGLLAVEHCRILSLQIGARVD